jgi:DNA-binding IclR family transcriptional regulator
MVKRPTQPPLGDWTTEREPAANISELARAAGLDRATVAKRLKAAGVKPVLERKKEKQFAVGAATAALGARSADGVDSSGYHKARTQKTTAEAARILLKLQRERGELAPVAELREGAYQLVKAMHQRFSRYARDARGRLFRAKTVSDLERILASDFALIFDDLKRDYPNIL